MVLTDTQIRDMQADLAIGNDESVFTDTELDRLYTRAGENYNLAVYYGWRQIMAGSAKWVDYQVAQTRVNRSQAFDHLQRMVAFWANESRNVANQVKIVGAVPVPTKHKSKPYEEVYLGKRNRSHAADWT